MGLYNDYLDNDGNDDMLNFTFSNLGTYTVCILHESPTYPFQEKYIDISVK